MSTRRMHALAILLALGAASPASAQDVTPTFHLEGGADVMLTDTYRDRFDWGGHGVVRAGIEVLGPLAVQVGFATSWFPVDGQDPGNLYAIELGARVFLPIDPAIGGPFFDVNGGAGITGEIVRFVFDVGVGWDFFPHPVFGIGPVVRYLQIVQPDGEPVGDDAHMIAFGLNLTARIDLGGDPAPEEADGDGDGDSVPDSQDRCPDEPEDVDRFADDDGCPDPDNDGDGIDDATDRCPDAAETRNGFEDDDGCPDEAPAPPPPAGAAEPEPEILPQTVLFRTGSDRVSSRFRDPIQEVCQLLISQPELRVRVIGHADEQGTPAANHRLGAGRAGAVAEQLVICGVGPRRIESTSYGDTRRACADESDECRARNRRVEFEILRPRGD